MFRAVCPADVKFDFLSLLSHFKRLDFFMAQKPVSHFVDLALSVCE